MATPSVPAALRLCSHLATSTEPPGWI
uniref:Uncharacterized protein n=1 Tax=Arundo donax TaxID=35708 RepID=A0A0A9FYB5_ARUDO